MTYRPSGLLAGLFVCFAFSASLAQTSAVSPSNAQLVSPQIEQKVDALLKQMTLDEKIGQLVQYNATEAHPAQTSDRSTAALNEL